jgi:hypothetical protein
MSSAPAVSRPRGSLGIPVALAMVAGRAFAFPMRTKSCKRVVLRSEAALQQDLDQAGELSQESARVCRNPAKVWTCTYSL